MAIEAGYKIKIKIEVMTFLEITLSNKTMLVLGILSALMVLFITVITFKRLNKKRIK